MTALFCRRFKCDKWNPDSDWMWFKCVIDVLHELAGWVKERICHWIKTEDYLPNKQQSKILINLKNIGGIPIMVTAKRWFRGINSMIKAQHLSFWPYLKSPDRFLQFSARYLCHIDGIFHIIFKSLKLTRCVCAPFSSAPLKIASTLVWVFAFFLGLTLIPITLMGFSF